MLAATLTPPFDGSFKKLRALPYVLLVGLFAVLVSVPVFTTVRMMNLDLHHMSEETGDQAWVTYQLGSEHSRFLVASEANVPPDELKARGEVYLSYVDRVRQSPQLRTSREAMITRNLGELEASAHRVAVLLEGVDTQQGRTALREQLRAEDQLIRDVVLEISKLYRKQIAMEHVRHGSDLRFYGAVLGILNGALLALAVITVWFGRRLVKSRRQQDRQYAILNSILASVEDGVLVMCPGGTVLYSSPRVPQLLGPGIESGWRLPEPVTPDDRLLAHVRALILYGRKSIAMGESLARNIQISNRGRMKHFTLRMCRATADCDEAPGDGSFIITVTDVTAEAEVAQKNDELDSLISNVSRVHSYAVISGAIVHEVSHPLVAIRNYIHALKNSMESGQDHLNHHDVVDHLGIEVDRAIDVLRNVRRMGPQEEKVDGSCGLDEAVEQSVRMVSLGSSPPPPITVTSGEVEILRLRGSLPQIGQVIINLLGNALRSSAAADKSGAEIILRRNGDCAEIMVADYGSGVTPEAAKQMFSPFAKSSGGGMGLGLAICQRIAASIGGSLSWENRATGGALFKFTVPLAEKGNTA